MGQTSVSEQTSTSSSKPGRITVSSADLPLHCPATTSELWNSHPQVYLPVEENGVAKCPYCGTEYILKNE